MIRIFFTNIGIKSATAVYVVPGRYLVDMCHPLLLLCGGGGVHGKGLAPGADQPAVLERQPAARPSSDASESYGNESVDLSNIF